MPRPDQHDEIEVNFLDRGSLTYLIGGRRVTVEAKTLSLFWAAVPHQIVEFRDVENYYVITIPFGRFLQWGLPEHLQTQLITGNAICSDRSEAVSSRDSELFAQWHHDLTRDSADVQEIVLLELKARLLRLARSQHKQTSAPNRDDGLGRTSPNLEKAERMACFIARNFKSRLLIKDIADSVDLHPDYAATLFRKTFGTTLNSLVTRHRIAEAQRLLVTRDDQIVNVAFDSGFESLSRFNRAFKESTGMTPRGFRKHCRQ